MSDPGRSASRSVLGPLSVILRGQKLGIAKPDSAKQRAVFEGAEEMPVIADPGRETGRASILPDRWSL
jgi:hypothetical protein